MRKQLVIGTFMFVLAGCNSNDPMQKLASNTIYPDINEAYWAKEQKAGSNLWKQALSYCQEHKEKPNCNAVLTNNAVNNGNTVLVPLNSNPVKEPG